MRPHIDDLDTLSPAWHLLDWDDYHYNIEPWGRMASILTSRGCMMGCSFCSHRLFWRGDWRARDPEKVVEEIRHLVDEYEVEFITLIDPYPTNDRERWEQLLDLLIEADLGVQPAHRDARRGHHPRRGHPAQVPRGRHHPPLPGRREQHRRDAREPEQGHRAST